MTPDSIELSTPAPSSLARLVARHAPIDGTHETPIEGVRLFRVSTPVDRVPGVYDPSICAVVAGSKCAYHDGRTHLYGPGRYLCTTMPTPVEAEIRHATADQPVLGVLVDLDTRLMTEFMIQHRAAKPVPPTSPGTEAAPGPTVVDWDVAFTDALVRLLELLEDPVALDLLGHGRLREFLYTVVEGEAGPAVRDALGASTHQLAPVLTFMRNNLDQPLAVDELADRAGMSRAAFDRHFRAATGMSPLRYLKALRLNDAAMLIANGAPVAHAAARVGYPSPSQFSREYARMFGLAPTKDVKRLCGTEPA